LTAPRFKTLTKRAWLSLCCVTLLKNN